MKRKPFVHTGAWSLAVLAFCLAGGTTQGQPAIKEAAPATSTDQLTPQANAAGAQFQASDRWCGIGDSITHTGFYTRYIYLFHATRFPDRPIDFINAGSAGDTAKGTLARLPKDVLRHRPTVATIMLGMNDVRRSLYLSKFDAPDAQAQRDAVIGIHITSMRQIAEELRAAGVRMIFITPSIFDETSAKPTEKSPGVNEALARCAESARELAAEFNSSLIDFHGPMSRLNLELQKTDPEASIIGPDRIHPKEPGGLIMAYLFLKAQGMPRFVDRIEEDAGGKREITFEHTARALPFPVPVECEPALKLIPFTEELNQEVLRVTNLPSGRYQILIDGELVASYGSGELKDGVNLAALSNTPQARQAQEVLKLDARRYELEQGIRTIDFYERGLNPNFGTDEPFDYMAALAKRPEPKDTWAKKNREKYLLYKPREQEVRKEKEELVAEMRKASHPRSHRFVIRGE